MRYTSYSSRLTATDKAAQQYGWDRLIIGASEEDRPIVAYQKNGKGIRAIAWALMHGNEPTGYEALFSLMGKSSNVHWCLIPVLNPDGAEAFTRENAHGVDINRDARAQRSKEAKALTEIIRLFKPDFAFNLHDQRARFYPKGANVPATFSLLAPKGHPVKETDSQVVAQRLLADWSEQLSLNWKGHCARFDDRFYPTAFGEFIQGIGIPTITFETGIAPNNWSRSQAAHQLTDLLTSLEKWHTQHNLPENIQTYIDLPFNASDANEWAIHHTDGVLHLRWKEKVEAGIYRSYWVAEPYHASSPTWYVAKVDVPMPTIQEGEEVRHDILQSLGLEAPDLGLKS